MADTVTAVDGTAVDGAVADKTVADPTKRDFLSLLTGSAVVIGVGALVWPFVDSMSPAKDVLALSSIEVDLAPVLAGQAVTVVWRGKPVFVRNRTPEEIKSAQTAPTNQLLQPETDADRVKAGKEKWLIVVGICTHLGCVPLGNKTSEQRGEYGGWFCPCHGSVYDTSGRVRKGPAPTNMAVPPYAFVGDTKIKIG
ncbi:MAG: ubiquinol-cytochrome c reductase iron-sulfur subunit [Gemmatimonadaceae bacterium]|nr:ubiquinol-cytochrome c reductase iron-sulfur subunit [Acetobacteraceae bacterium]